MVISSFDISHLVICFGFKSDTKHMLESHEVSTTERVGPLSNYQCGDESRTHPHGGTDFMGPQHACWIRVNLWTFVAQTIYDSSTMIGHPQPNEAAPYYSGYINLVSTDNILQTLDTQMEETVGFLSGISEEQSLHRYAPDKWSVRELLNHVNDTERVFLYRAFWFARGFETPLPGYDQDICAVVARADEFSWDSHVDDFRSIRLSTLSFLRNLTDEAWLRTGIANDNSFTVRALAYIIAGHVTHHTIILRERYL